jgi:hypothetical protein
MVTPSGGTGKGKPPILTVELIMSVCRPAFLVSLLVLSLAAEGADWYVAPEGTSANPGTKESPWDIGSAWIADMDIASIPRTTRE